MISTAAILPPRMEIGRLGSRRARDSLSLRSRKTTGSPSWSVPLRYGVSTVARVGLLDGIGAVAFFFQLLDQLAHFLGAVEIADQQRVGRVHPDGLLKSQEHHQTIRRVPQAVSCAQA